MVLNMVDTVVCRLIKSLPGFQPYGRNIQKHYSLTRNWLSPRFLFLLVILCANFTSCGQTSLYYSIDDTKSYFIAHCTTSGFAIDSAKSTESAKCEVNSTHAEVNSIHIPPVLFTFTKHLQRVDSHRHNQAKLKVPLLMIMKRPAEFHRPQTTQMTALTPIRSSRESHTFCELSSRTDLIAIPSDPVPSCLHSPRGSTISDIPTSLIDIVILHRHMMNQDFHHCPLVEYRLQCTLTDLENLLATCPLRNTDDDWFYEWSTYLCSSYTIDTFLLQNFSDRNILVIDHHKVFPIRIQFILFYATVLTLASRSLDSSNDRREDNIENVLSSPAPTSNNLYVSESNIERPTSLDEHHSHDQHVADRCSFDESSSESDTFVSDDNFATGIASVHSMQQVDNKSITQNSDTYSEIAVVPGLPMPKTSCLYQYECHNTSEIAGMPSLPVPKACLYQYNCHNTLQRYPEPPDNNYIIIPAQNPFLNQFGGDIS